MLCAVSPGLKPCLGVFYLQSAKQAGLKNEWVHPKIKLLKWAEPTVAIFQPYA